jgi:hypothetical protein
MPARRGAVTRPAIALALLSRPWSRGRVAANSVSDIAFEVPAIWPARRRLEAAGDSRTSRNSRSRLQRMTATSARRCSASSRRGLANRPQRSPHGRRPRRTRRRSPAPSASISAGPIRGEVHLEISSSAARPASPQPGRRAAHEVPPAVRGERRRPRVRPPESLISAFGVASERSSVMVSVIAPGWPAAAGAGARRFNTASPGRPSRAGVRLLSGPVRKHYCL